MRTFALVRNLITRLSRWTNPSSKPDISPTNRGHEFTSRQELLQLVSKAKIHLVEDNEMLADEVPDGTYVTMMSHQELLRSWLESRDNGNQLATIKLILMDGDAYFSQESRDKYFAIFPCLVGRSPTASPALCKWHQGRCVKCVFGKPATEVIREV